MAATVRAIKATMPAKRLEAKIDEAGMLHEQAKAYSEAYDRLRKEIAMLMPLDETTTFVQKSGVDYEAKHTYPDVKHISPEDLWTYCKNDKAKFWGLVRVNLGDAEKTIPGPDFHKLLRVEEAIAPKLTITKIKKRD